MTEFVHKRYGKEETIAALATPPGEGGVAIVRISGKGALDVAESLFSKDVHALPSHTLTYGALLDSRGEIIDKVLLAVLRAPKSYTGEETVEIHCHGGSLITQRVLEAALQAGARSAEPGEFTYRAFVHGKIDLSQAEAVQELIGAKSASALILAQKQLEGGLSQQIRSFQQELTDIAAILEACVDFPEEGLEFASQEEIQERLHTVQRRIDALEATYEEGKMLLNGVSLCLIGPPNSGKSSLLNAFLRKERAIVTPIAGTTRDLLEEQMRIGSLSFRLIDTAGIREARDLVEQEGIRRAKKASEEADLTLLILDASERLSAEAQALIGAASKHKTLLIWNKTDLPCKPLPEVGLEALMLSAKTGAGLEELKQRLEKWVGQGNVQPQEDVVIGNLRHKNALKEASEALTAVLEGLKSGLAFELLSSDLRAALSALGTIIGTHITEDILSSIFSRFCIGK